MKVEFTTDNKPLANIVLQAVGIVLGYIRNSFFLMSAMMIFFIFVMIQISLLYEAELDLNMLGHILVSLDNMPMIGKYIDINQEMHVDGKDLAIFFFNLSFIFTIFTEIVYYFRRYVLKSDLREATWAGLKKRLIFVFAALTFMHIAVFSDLIWQTGDVSTGILIFVMFWIISVGSTVMFLLFDFLIKKLRKIKV